MRAPGSTRGLSSGAPSTWLVRLLSLVFIGLGLLFLLAPLAGAALFGFAAPEGQGFGYLPAVGLRDLIIVSAARGSDAIFHLLLHGASAAVMAAGSIWLLRSSANDKQGGQP